jgi:hypothetical protein
VLLDIGDIFRVGMDKGKQFIFWGMYGYFSCLRKEISQPSNRKIV